METFHLIGSLGFSMALGSDLDSAWSPRGPGLRWEGAPGRAGPWVTPPFPPLPGSLLCGRGRSAVGHRLAAPVMETVKHLSTV